MPAADIDDLDDLAGPTPDQRRNASALYVKFDYKNVKNEERTKQESRACFDRVEYIRKMVPGDKTLEIHAPATDADREMHAAAYRAFKNDQDQDTASGTPLEMWPLMDSARVEELREFRVRTVEQLAGISDGNLSKMGTSTRKEQQAAKDWLAAAAGMAPVTQLRAENDELKATVEAQGMQLIKALAAIDALQKGQSALDAPQKKQRGAA